MNSLASPPHPEATQPRSLTIRLLGEFVLQWGATPIPLSNTPRLQALLTYLLLHRQEPQSRRRLAFLFWPDSGEAQALTNLRKQLLYLRQLFPACDTVLHVERQSLQWSPTVPITLDVEAFRAALAEATHAPDQQAIAALRRAVACYRGELLPGCYDEWIFAERETLNTQYGQALERLSGLLETQRTYADAITYSEQCLHHDPLHEPTYRRLMRLHALNGDRPAALRVYHTCVTQLREELGVDPDAETQAVYERLLQVATVTTPQPELAADAPFVSRQREWQLLQQRWQLAVQGQPQLVLIAGEAGIGKTRLAEELLYWATHQGFCTVRARCYAAEGRLTYAPVIEWLRSEPLRPQRRKLEANWLTELARLLPEILNEQPTLPPPGPITQSWQRNHLFAAATRALLVIERPLLLLLDDLQWCDKETLELLHFLLRHAATFPQTPLLLLGTARLPDEVDATHPLYELLNPLRGSATLTQLDLTRLTEAETSELARRMVDHPLDARTLHQLFRDTAGNPLFVVETLRAAQGKPLPSPPQLGEGVVDGASVPPPRLVGEAVIHALPPKVLAVIQARLGTLSPIARELCEWAAIVGRAFTGDLLTAASKIDPGQAVNALDELWQRRIIREQGNDAYDFSHDRIRDVAAAGVSRVRKKYLHRCVAEALEQQHTHQLDNSAAQIAAHYEVAGMNEKAIHYYQLAAESERRVYANHEALAHLQNALLLLNALPITPERDKQELEVLVSIIPLLASISAYTSVQLSEVHQRAYRLAQQLGFPLNPSVLRTLVVYRLGFRDFAQASAWGHQIIALAQQRLLSSDTVVYVEGCYVLGVTAFWQGQFGRARDHLRKALESYSPAHSHQHIAEYGHDPAVYCGVRIGWNLWYLGFPDQARQHCIAAVALAQELQHPFSLYMALVFSSWLYIDCRDVTNAAAYTRLLQAQDHPMLSQIIALQQLTWGWYLSQRGEIAAGIAQILDYLAFRRQSNSDQLYGPYALGILAETYWSSGMYDQGLAAVEEAFALLRGNLECWYIAELYRLRGELLTAQGGQTPDGEACFQQALAIARQQQAKSLELRAAMSLARFWEQQGRRAEAYTLLTEIYSWFTEGFDTPDLQAARRMLERFR